MIPEDELEDDEGLDEDSALGEPHPEDSDYWFEMYGVESEDELLDKD
jgi:hypothetical protein